MDNSIKTALALLLIAGLLLLHISALKTDLAETQTMLIDEKARATVLQGAVATNTAAVSALELESKAMKARGAKAEEKAREAAQEHERAIAEIRRTQIADCDPERLQLKIRREILNL